MSRYLSPGDKFLSIFRILVLGSVFLFFGTGPSHAQDQLDWYYSAVFGTGSYRIGDRDVFVVSVPYTTQLREATEGKPAIMFNAEVTAGFYDYNIDDALDLEVPTDVATLSIFPGIYYVIPMSEKWRIKPYANLGYGKEFEGGETAWIYSAGIKSLYRYYNNEWRVLVGNDLYYAGNTREAGPDLGFVGFDVALDVSHATNWHIDNNDVYVGGYFVVSAFTDLQFVVAEDSVLEINRQYEVGVALSTRNKFSFLGMNVDRIGLGYVFNKDLRAWRLAFSLPY